MTHLAVPIAVPGVEAVEPALADAARAAEHGADLIEWRIDVLDDAEAIAVLVEQSALPSVVTCRTEAEGGAFTGDGEELVDRYRAAIGGTRKPIAIDVELLRVEQDPTLAAALSELSAACERGLIFSTHDFTGRPADLTRRVAGMAEHPHCAIVKAAWRARSLRDNLEAFDLMREYRSVKPIVALCMGEFGLPSRVLAGKFGGWMTFAAIDAGKGTAPGQPTLDEIKRLYRWDRITARTPVYGVVGWPVGHSLSPHIHNAGFDALDEELSVDSWHGGVYLPMPIADAWEQFKATVGAWVDHDGLDFGGCSVTIPHKAHLLRFVADRDGGVETLSDAIGAANTLVAGKDEGRRTKDEVGGPDAESHALTDDRRRADADKQQASSNHEPSSFVLRPSSLLRAFNTDYAAALDAVCEAMGIEHAMLQGVRVGVIGAGGAAAAIVAAFAAQGATVVVYNRTMSKADALVDRFDGNTGKVVAAPLDKLCDTCCAVLINCTPVGMHPKIDATPAEGLFDGETLEHRIGHPPVVFDTIYNPAETRLLREAKAAGCKTVSGVEMFVRQAAGQFAAWTGHAAPMDVFERVVHASLDR
ncbi:MAG: type I 3-dehydroquinate dehydratase [Planctomycetota bacterium]